MKKIKIIYPVKNYSQLLRRQTPNNLGIWGDCQFIFDDEIGTDFDYVFVFHRTSLNRPIEFRCDLDKVYFVSMEYRDLIDTKVFNYPKFYRQFPRIVTSDDSLPHQNKIIKNIHTWWVGLTVSAVDGIHSIKCDEQLNYDILQSPLEIEKKDRIAIITSRNAWLPGHKKRSEFINFLQESELSSIIDVLGFDRNPINDKFEVLKNYKYHLVLENSIFDHYWTEKLADSFLSECYPLYWGCQNIYDYFPEKSLVLLDISDFSVALSQIKSAFNNNFHSLYARELIEAKHKILNEYNLFNEIANICMDYSSNPKLIKINPPLRTLKRTIFDYSIHIYRILKFTISLRFFRAF